MSISVPRSEPVTPAEPLPGTNTIPALHEGDRLTRDEFERATMRCRISRKLNSLKELSTCLHRLEVTIMVRRTSPLEGGSTITAGRRPAFGRPTTPACVWIWATCLSPTA